MSFGPVARVYERGRPSYPSAAVDFLLTGLPEPTQEVAEFAGTVVDLGAGTGKLSRVVAGRATELIAVEPSEGMRAEFGRQLPRVRCVAGSGEEIPLPDRSVDAVLCAQAWHWVDPRAVVPEVARVLRPGGVIGMVWNMRDENEDWVAELGTILRQVHRQPRTAVEPVLDETFEPVTRHDIHWYHETSVAELLDMVSSRSYIALLEADHRASLLDQVAELLRVHPSLSGRERFELPYVSECFRAIRR